MAFQIISWSGTVMEGQNTCIDDWLQEVKILNTEPRELPTLLRAEEYVQQECSNKPSRVCPHYDYSTCNTHFLARHPQYERQTHGLLPSAKSATQVLPRLHQQRHLLASWFNCYFHSPQLLWSKYSGTPHIHINSDGKRSRHAENPDFSLETGYISCLKFCCHYLRYVPVSKPFDHTWFEVLEAITLYCAWFDNWKFQGKLVF